MVAYNGELASDAAAIIDRSQGKPACNRDFRALAHPRGHSMAPKSRWFLPNPYNMRRRVFSWVPEVGIPKPWWSKSGNPRGSVFRTGREGHSPAQYRLTKWTDQSGHQVPRFRHDKLRPRAGNIVAEASQVCCIGASACPGWDKHPHS